MKMIKCEVRIIDERNGIFSINHEGYRKYEICSKYNFKAERNLIERAKTIHQMKQILYINENKYILIRKNIDKSQMPQCMLATLNIYFQKNIEIIEEYKQNISYLLFIFYLYVSLYRKLYICISSQIAYIKFYTLYVSYVYKPMSQNYFELASCISHIIFFYSILVSIFHQHYSQYTHYNYSYFFLQKSIYFYLSFLLQNQKLISHFQQIIFVTFQLLQIQLNELTIIFFVFCLMTYSHFISICLLSPQQIYFSLLSHSYYHYYYLQFYSLIFLISIFIISILYLFYQSFLLPLQSTSSYFNLISRFYIHIDSIPFFIHFFILQFSIFVIFILDDFNFMHSKIIRFLEFIDLVQLQQINFTILIVDVLNQFEFIFNFFYLIFQCFYFQIKIF